MREKTSEKNSPKIVLKARPSQLPSPVPSELKRVQPALIENMEQKAAFYKSAKVSICFPTKTDGTVHTHKQFYSTSVLLRISHQCKTVETVKLFITQHLKPLPCNMLELTFSELSSFTMQCASFCPRFLCFPRARQTNPPTRWVRGFPDQASCEFIGCKFPPRVSSCLP